MLTRIAKIAGAVVLIIAVGAVAAWYFLLRPKPLPISAEDRLQLNLMPLPAKAKVGSGEFLLSSTLGIRWSGITDSVAIRAGSRFFKHVEQLTDISFSTAGTGIQIHIDSLAPAVQRLKENESYTLRISTRTIELHAASRYGVLHGLESLRQLVKKNNNRFVLPVIDIEDQPRYPWRGFMLDVSRHWIPKEDVLRNLESMAAVKLNVLHWHLTDYQGFRVESKAFPKLHELGSEGNYYTQDDIREVIAFARDRGIRVVPEFDLPGHSTSILVGYPELGSAPGPYQLDTNFGVLTPVLDPTRESVYEFLDKFIGEMAQLFPDEYIHIGGDEVADHDWKVNAGIQQFMKDHSFATSKDLQAYFNQRMEKIFHKHGKKMAGWDEILHPDLSKEIVVQSWRSHRSLFEAVQKNGNALLSYGLYLDHKQPAGRHYKVDPEILAGAVTITPDTLHWQQYSLTLQVNGNPMPVSLVLFGETPHLRGLFGMLENNISFETATLEQGHLAFEFTSDFGTINVTGDLQADSISGKLSLGLLSFPFQGVRTGGNDVAGTRPPHVEQIKPLTTADKARILGGEAAMWTEVVSSLNVDTRVWPRLAAIAEKFWSPAVLTTDGEDMYRRLAFMNDYLALRGSKHIAQQDSLIAHLAEGRPRQPVRTLVEVLEEVKLYDRLAQSIGTLSTHTPLTEVVDAALPESLIARRFNQQVHAFLADSSHTIYAKELRAQLTSWRNNHYDFMMQAQQNPRLARVLGLSSSLGALSVAGLAAMDALQNKKPLTEADRRAWDKVLQQAVFSQASAMLAVEPGLRELLTAR